MKDILVIYISGQTANLAIYITSVYFIWWLCRLAVETATDQTSLVCDSVNLYIERQEYKKTST